MVGGLESARSVAAPRRAVRARRPGRRCCATRSSRPRACARARARGWIGDERPPTAAQPQPDDGRPAGRLAEVVDALRGGRASTWIGPWRHKVAEVGVERAAGRIRDAGPAGLEPVPRRLLPRAAARGGRRQPPRGRGGRGARAPTCSCSSAGRRSGATSRGARARSSAGIERLLPYADEHGVRLGDRAAAPDDDRRALGDRHARRGARHGRAVRRAPRRRRRRRLPRLVGPAAGRGDRARRPADRRLPRQRLARPDHRPCSRAAG